VKDMRSPASALMQQGKLVDEKTAKGYKEKVAKKAKANGKAAAIADDVAADIPDGAWRLVDGKTFWQIKLDAKQYVITTGKLGTPGKTEKKKFKGEWEARTEHNRLLSEKKKKGFTFVLSGLLSKKPVTPAQNPQLESQIAKDPTNDDNFSVYADWLQEQGDVRGELAGLQMQAAKKPKDKKLRNAIDKLIADYRAYLFGPLAIFYVPKVEEYMRAINATWRAGWIDELELSAPNAYGELKTPMVQDIGELVGMLPKVASARFMRSLVIAKPTCDGEFAFAGGVEQLVKAMPVLPALRRVEIGRFTYEDSELSWSHLGPMHRFWPAAKHIEFLKVRSGSMDLGKIALPEGREFELETGGLDKGDMKSIVNAVWPKLERLSVWFGQENYGANCTIKDVAPLLEGNGLGKLKHLGLKNSTFGDDIIAAVAKSKIVRQLESLDLSMSHITTADLEKLPKDCFKHLASLDLSRCRLDKKGEKLAKGLAKTVEVRDQDAPSDWEGPDYRYAAVGE
jgi:uncharacterized protein (TIGR02996 family)